MSGLWPFAYPEHAGESDEVCQAIGQIAPATNKRGIFDYGCGGDGENLFKFYIDNGHDFVVRLVGGRNLLDWSVKKKSQVLAGTLARQCTLKYEDSVLYKSHNKVRSVRIKYGSMPVRFPVRSDAEPNLVAVKWPNGKSR